MGRITGRSDDMIILRGVNLFPSQIEEITLRIPELSPHFQLVLTRPEGQRMDQLTVKIERRDNVTAEDCATAARTLREQITTESGLILDPWLETYLLMQVGTQGAPRLQQQLGVLASVGQGAVGNQDPFGLAG